MYASSNAMPCTVCGKGKRSVTKRLVRCFDGCDQGIEMILCDECARELNEEAGDE